MKCIDCPMFKDRTFFPHTGGTSGKCYDSNSPKYGQWMVGAWGCKRNVIQKDLFINF